MKKLKELTKEVMSETFVKLIIEIILAGAIFLHKDLIPIRFQTTITISVWTVILLIAFILVAIWMVYGILRTIKRWENKEKTEALTQKVFRIIQTSWTDIKNANPIGKDELDQPAKNQRLIDEMKKTLLNDELSWMSKDELNKCLDDFFKGTNFNKGYPPIAI